MLILNRSDQKVWKMFLKQDIEPVIYATSLVKNVDKDWAISDGGTDIELKQSRAGSITQF